MRAACMIAVLVATSTGAWQSPPSLASAVKEALTPALPFPEAQADGTPRDGGADPAWTVTWPTADEPRVEVLANPLHAGNRQRALKAEEEIQKAAMQSQRRSQADYDKAVTDFQATGRVSAIREISLRDDGVAGERFDAESHLAIFAADVDERHDFSVSTSVLPQASSSGGAPAAVIRLAANTYLQQASSDEPVVARYVPEQAWVYIGAVAPPVVERRDESSVSVSVARAPGRAAARVVVVHLSGNAELVDRVLRQADWTRLSALIGG